MELNKLLDQDFAVESYIDYMAHCQKKLNGLLSIFGELIDNADPEQDVDQITFLTWPEILTKLESFGLGYDNIIATSEGWVPVRDAIANFKDAYQSLYSGVISSINEAPCYVYSSHGSQGKITTFQDFFDSIKSNIIASVCESSALKAAKFTSISDRLNYFNTIITSSLDANDSLVLNALNYYKDNLLNDSSPFQLFNEFMSKSGASQLQADEEAFTIMDFDVAKYTGANPLGALSIATFTEAGKTIGKVVGTAAVGIWNAVKTGVNWLWNKAKKYTVEVFSDPYDVTDSGQSNEKFCFENFQYQRRYTEFVDPTGQWNDVLLTDTGLSINDFREVAATLTNKWFLIKTIGGEVAINPDAVSITASESNPELVHIQYKGTVLFKPYSLNPQIVGNTADEFSLKAASFLDGMYLDTKASEHDLFNSFSYGTAVTMSILMAYADYYSQTDYPHPWNPTFNSPSQDYTITNLDWLKKATGYNPSTGHFDTMTWSPQAASIGANLINLGAGLLNVILISKALSNKFNLIESNYVPYSQNTQGMSKGRFSIKSDQQNQAVAEAFTSAIVAIVIIAVVVITGAVIIRKVSRKLFWKRTEFIAKCDSAMWDGNILSARDKRKYIRYSRKLSVSTLLNKGINGMESLSDKLSSATDSLATKIIDVVKGSNNTGDNASISAILRKIG